MSTPVVLFACVHNGGRSLAAKVLAEHHARGRVDVRSAGSEPGDGLDPAVVQVLHERGLSTGGETPTLLTPESVQQADVVVASSDVLVDEFGDEDTEVSQVVGWGCDDQGLPTPGLARLPEDEHTVRTHALAQSDAG